MARSTVHYADKETNNILKKLHNKGSARKIKDAFAANLSSRGRIDLDAIFANPIYARLIGDFEAINRKFDGRLREIVERMQDSFRKAV